MAYAYDNGSRGRKVIAGLLDGRKVKAIHTDGYNVYFFLKDIGVVQICCGAHMWRKLKEWFEQTDDPEARVLLPDIGELFLMEARFGETNAPPKRCFGSVTPRIRWTSSADLRQGSIFCLINATKPEK